MMNTLFNDLIMITIRKTICNAKLIVDYELLLGCIKPANMSYAKRNFFNKIYEFNFYEVQRTRNARVLQPEN